MQGLRYPNIAAQFVAASSQSATIADNASLSMGAGVRMSVAAWVNQTTLQTQAFLEKGAGLGTPATLEYGLFYSVGSSRISLRVSTGAASTTAQANTFGVPVAGVWTFVVATYDGANIGMSVNAGVIDNTAFSADIQDSTQNFSLGGDTFLNGLLDCVGFWKVALATAQLAKLYKGGVGMAYRDLDADLKTGLVSYWNLDGNLNDSHGTNHLTNSNGVAFGAGKR